MNDPSEFRMQVIDKLDKIFRHLMQLWIIVLAIVLFLIFKGYFK